MSAHCVLVVLVVALSCLALGNPGTSDVAIWTRWVARADELGIRAGYAASTGDYPPLSAVALALTARAGDLLASSASLPSRHRCCCASV